MLSNVSLHSTGCGQTITNVDTLLENNHFNPLNFTYQRTSIYHQTETDYAFLRFTEFLSNTCLILNRRLTPGFSKNGRVNLVGIDWKLLDHFLCTFKSHKTQRKIRPVIDRMRVDVIYYYYDFKELPDLGAVDWWIKRHEPNEEFREYSESYYTRVKFGVCSATQQSVGRLLAGDVVGARIHDSVNCPNKTIFAYNRCQFLQTRCRALLRPWTT